MYYQKNLSCSYILLQQNNTCSEHGALFKYGVRNNTSKFVSVIMLGEKHDPVIILVLEICIADLSCTLSLLDSYLYIKPSRLYI